MQNYYMEKSIVDKSELINRLKDGLIDIDIQM